MLIVFGGPSCSGKSSCAARVAESIGASVYSGKDYARLAKSEGEAWKLFSAELAKARGDGPNLIYVVTETEHYARLGTLAGFSSFLFTAELPVLLDRFCARVQKSNPAFRAMLEAQSRAWDAVRMDHRVDTSSASAEETCAAVLSRLA